VNQGLCCHTSTSAHPPYTPFGKVLSLGWYDGTTSGLAKCASCSTIFKYDIVDWDADQEQRIFVLSHVTAHVFDRIVDTLGAFESPKWPFWNPKWNIVPHELKEQTKSKVDSYLSSTNEPVFLIASDRELKRVFAVGQITDAIRAKLPEEFNGLPVTSDFAFWITHLTAK
jgi:hypothetical protein